MPALRTASRGLLLATSALALVACATKPDLGPAPEMRAGPDFETSRSFEAHAAPWPSDRWWEGYGDSGLAALIDEALAGAPSLAAAEARLRGAMSEAQQAGAARYPTIGGEAAFEATRRDISTDKLSTPTLDAFPNDWSGQFSAGLSLQYQLDFFGRNRAAFAAATSRADAAAAEAAQARLQLSTAVALAYADLIRLSADRAALEDAATLRQESAALVASRVDAGLENDGPAYQATSEFAEARAALIAVDASIARARHQIAALLGKGPDRGLEIAVPAAPTIAARGLPPSIALELVARRPDLVAARRYAEAAAEQIKVARADFYPNVNLIAVGGMQAFPFGSFAGNQLGFAQAGPATTLPIFSGGRIEGAYRGARAAYDEAVALYNQTFADALRDVADAIGDYRALEMELAEKRLSLSAAEGSYRVVRDRYEGGLASYIDTLSIESSLIERRRAVADLEARAIALDIILVRALGGGVIDA